MLREYYSLETDVPLHTLVINDGRDTHDRGPLHTLAINDACCCPGEVRGINIPPLPIIDGWGEG